MRGDNRAWRHYLGASHPAQCPSVIAPYALISKLVARIRLLDFGAKDVEPTVFTWPIDFLPSS